MMGQVIGNLLNIVLDPISRRGQRHCRHLQGVMGLPNKEGIRQIINQHHQPIW